MDDSTSPGDFSGSSEAQRPARKPAERTPAWTPGWPFHALLLIPTLMLLAGVSWRGVQFFLAAPAVLALGIAALVWLVALVLAIRDAVKRPVGATRGLWRFWIAPVAGLLVLALVWGQVPLRLRWAMSRSAFEEYVATAPAPVDDEWVGLATPGDLGLFDIRNITQVGQAIIFYERTGGFFEHAGFAYLPSGPFEELDTGWFEVLAFSHLGGPWYAFTAGW